MTTRYRARPYSSRAARDFYAQEAEADQRRDEREKHLAWARSQAPLCWTASDAFSAAYWGMPYQDILGNPDEAQRFEVIVAKTQRLARAGREIDSAAAERAAALLWPFALHEEAMKQLRQGIERDAQTLGDREQVA